MAGRAEFSIALNLLADGFKRSAESVKSSIRSIQYQVLGMTAAFGAGGLGLSNLVSRFVDVARETNKARVALKNISGGSVQYAENIQFLRGLSKKYGQELNVLTSNYAKFSAAATSANVSIADQQKIFNSVSRAATAFGMGTEDVNLTFLAISQMMSKGKISSEELRRQLGERMPIAMAAMAKAAGVPISQLDELIKKGKLMSADIMPKFADALESMLPNVNTDNIETSIARLQNAFIDLTDKLKIGEHFKNIVDWATDTLEKIKNGTSSLVAFVIALVSGKLGSVIIGYYNKLSALRASYVKQAEVAQVQVQLATEKRVAAEKALEESRVLFSKAKDGERVAAKRAVVQAEKALEVAKHRELRAIQVQAESEQKASLVRSQGVMGGFFSTVKMGAMRLLGTLRALWASFAPMAIISGIVYIITKFVQMRQEAERVRNIFSDYKKELSNIGGGEEAERLKTLHKIVKERLGTENEINAARAELLRMLGLQKASEDEINKAVSDRIALLEATARVDFAVRKKLEAEDEIKSIAAKYGGAAEYNKAVKRQNATDKAIGGTNDTTVFAEWLLSTLDSLFDQQNGKGSAELKNDREKIKQLYSVISHSDKTAINNEKIRLKYSQPTKTTTATSDDDDKGKKDKKTDLEKAEEKYVEALKDLTFDYENKKLKQEEYNKKLDELNYETYKSLSLTDGGDKSKYFETVKKGAKNPVYKEDTEYEKAEKEYFKKLKELDNQLANKAVTEEEYKDELVNLINSTIKAVGAMDNIGEGGKEFIKTLQGDRSAISVMPTEGQRDTTFDYKKTDTDKLEEVYKLKEKYVDELKKKVPDAIKEIEKAESQLKTLGEQLKVAEVREDIKNLEKDLRFGLLDTTKDLIGGAGRLYNAFKNINEVLENSDANGFEQLLSVFDAIFQAVDGVMSTIETIEKLTEVTNALAGAKKSQQMIDNAATAQHVANVATAVTADVTGATATAAAKTTEVGANTAAAASSAGASAAKLPFPINLIAISAAIAGVIALFASIPKFAHGGIVTGGSYSGDNIVAGLNSGEMVLTTPQQGNLWRMLKNGTSLNSSGGNVEFRIKGRELVGILKQESQRSKR